MRHITIQGWEIWANQKLYCMYYDFSEKILHLLKAIFSPYCHLGLSLCSRKIYDSF